ncbi:hypothetical protein ABN09_05125 [Morganella morganii]|nr:hypothetical protein ABN09_05125 [Morganella morganii]
MIIISRKKELNPGRIIEKKRIHNGIIHLYCRESSGITAGYVFVLYLSFYFHIYRMVVCGG